MGYGVRVFGAGMLLIVGAVAGVVWGENFVPAPVAAATAGENLRMTNDVRVYQMVKDGVVNISSTRIVTARVGTGDQVFDRFFGGQIRQVPAESLGSGFVIHPSGYIVTNEHVIDEATEVNVQFSNGDKLPALVIATDNEHDLAVLKVTPKKPLTAVQLGASEDLMIGEPVCAIGNPFGYAGTMTRGIVSAVNRTLEVDKSHSYKNLIQTDASINPGNSGGPLINAYGQVVGVNTAIRADAQGIGFAIGISSMRDLLPAFLNPEALNRAKIGFAVEEKRTITAPAGVASRVVVKTVEADGPAAKAGLAVGDELVEINKTPVNTIVDALVSLSVARPGTKLVLAVERGTGSGAKRMTVEVPVEKAAAPVADKTLMEKLGVEAETITPELATKLNLPIGRGVVITVVNSGGAASKAGIEAGDVLFQLGPYYVSSVEDVATLLKTVNQAMDVRVGIIRGQARGHGVVHLQ
jgi:serine protease Do